MTDRQENKVSMWFKLRSFFNEHLAILSLLIPGLSAKVDAFNDKLDVMSDLESLATENLTGYSEQKQDMRNEIRDKALAISAGFVAYALDIKDKPLANKGDYTKSFLDKLRDSEFLFKCDHLIDLCNNHIANLPDYGVTAAKLADLANLLGNLKQLLLETDHRRSDVVGYGESVDDIIEDMDEKLRIIDALMGTVLVTNPLLHTIYFTDRLIDDDTSGSGVPPNETFTIAPGTFHTALSIAYHPGRSFKAMSLSPDVVNWGLSISAASFSNPPHTLAGNTVSTKLSSTLGPDGDILLFQNTSANAVDIEVTIIE